MLENKNKNFFSGMTGKYLTPLIAAIAFVVFVIIALCTYGGHIKNFIVILICECLIGICAYFIFCLSRLNKKQKPETDETYDEDAISDVSETERVRAELRDEENFTYDEEDTFEQEEDIVISERPAAHSITVGENTSEARVFEKVETPKYTQSDRREPKYTEKPVSRRNTGELTNDNMDEILSKIESIQSRRSDTDKLMYKTAEPRVSDTVREAVRTERTAVAENFGARENFGIKEEKSNPFEKKTPQVQTESAARKEISPDELFTGSITNQPASDKKIGGDLFKGTGYRSPFEKKEENK